MDYKLAQKNSAESVAIGDFKIAIRRFMSSTQFITLLTREINSFIGTFAHDSNSLFKNENDKLIHPSEYGMYRERCLRRLLQLVLSREYSVTDGFIITSHNNISTQCDILVNNAFTMPLTDRGLGNFYPVEDVCAIVEVKSDLTKRDLTNALQKLSVVKRLSDDRKGVITSKTHFLNQKYIPSFLVCNKIKCDIEALNYSEIYKDIDRRYWHNAILSLEDGIILYGLQFKDFPPRTKKHYQEHGFDVENGRIDFQYSQHLFDFTSYVETHNCTPKYIKIDQDNKYNHILYFLTVVKQSIDEMIRYQFDSIEYLGFHSKTLYKH